MFPFNARAVLFFAVMVTLAALASNTFAALAALVITITIAIIDLRDSAFLD